MSSAVATHKLARLSARPCSNGIVCPRVTGKHLLGAEPGAWLYVPATYNVEQPGPLVVLLHGAGGRGETMLGMLQSLSDERGFILFAPDSRASTWDAIRGGFGPDVAFIGQALEQLFASYAIDPQRVAIAGFSDGASYALALGLANGDLFRTVLAFSPGFSVAAELSGKPRIFVSHGLHDRVLPIESCSRLIVPRLMRNGYQVSYCEFDGPHSVPSNVASEAVSWFLNS